MRTYHPNIETLNAYAIGGVDSAHGLAVSTHIENCSRCQKLVADIEKEQARELESVEVPESTQLDASLSSMLDSIMSLEADFRMPELKKPVAISVDGKDFTLPASLSKIVELMGDWKSYGGKVFTSSIQLDEQSRMSLLYIAKGVQVPQHTHKGRESTLVLHGCFSDENGTYEKGDFIETDDSIRHAPQTAAHQDCLCLSILTEPLVFTKGVARVFNMFGKGMYP
jgi:putative transcriptional regulator